MEEEHNYSLENRDDLSQDNQGRVLLNIPSTSANSSHSETSRPSTSSSESTETANMAQENQNSPLVLYAIGENGSLVPYVFNAEPQIATPGSSQRSGSLSFPEYEIKESQRRRYISIKIAADMVPTFNGETPPVLSFIRACRSAENSVHPGDRPFLTTLIRNKIKGTADLFLDNNPEADS